MKEMQNVRASVMPKRGEVLRMGLLALVALLVVATVPGDLSASATGIYAPLGSLREMITDFAKPLFVVLVAAGGITWGVSEGNEGVKKIGKALVGCSIAIFCLSIATTLGLGGSVL